MRRQCRVPKRRPRGDGSRGPRSSSPVPAPRSRCSGPSSTPPKPCGQGSLAALATMCILVASAALAGYAAGLLFDDVRACCPPSVQLGPRSASYDRWCSCDALCSSSRRVPLRGRGERDHPLHGPAQRRFTACAAKRRPGESPTLQQYRLCYRVGYHVYFLYLSM